MNDQWFTREDTGTIQFSDRQSAVARVIARGSTPAAIAEAEGDFGPGGIFSLDDCLAGRTDPHQCDCMAMFDTLTEDERRALSHQLVNWLCRFGDVSHTLARVALANGEVDGLLWDRREQYLDINHELQELYAEARVA